MPTGVSLFNYSSVQASHSPGLSLRKTLGSVIPSLGPSWACLTGGIQTLTPTATLRAPSQCRSRRGWDHSLSETFRARSEELRRWLKYSGG